MPRRLFRGRHILNFYDDDVQNIIDDRSSTAQVYRSGHNTVMGKPTRSLIATFQCRIDPYAPRPHGEEDVTMLGKAAQRTYLLLARYGNDIFGSPVILEHGDTVVVDGITYRCTQLLLFPEGSKIEAVLVHVE